MWPRTKLTSLLGIRHPILQAPMAGAASAELAAAVSAAGGLGGFGAAGTDLDQLRLVIRSIRDRAGAPFNINLFTPVGGRPEPNEGGEAEIKRALEPLHRELQAGSVPGPAKLFGGFDEKLSLILDEGVPIVSLHFGAAGRRHLKALKKAGIVVISTATSVEEAEYLEIAGVDAIIAQGFEAGGHQGTFLDEPQTRMSTLTLVPAVVDAVGVPVIAAGGIVDGRSIAAAFSLGASGVQLGTAFLACKENDIPAAYRRAVLASTGAETRMTSAISGRPARALHNRLVEVMEPLDRLRYPEHYSMTRRLRAAASGQGNDQLLAMWAGMGVGKVDRELPAAAVVESLAADAFATFAALATPAQQIAEAETTEIVADGD